MVGPALTYPASAAGTLTAVLPYGCDSCPGINLPRAAPFCKDNPLSPSDHVISVTVPGKICAVRYKGAFALLGRSTDANGALMINLVAT